MDLYMFLFSMGASMQTVQEIYKKKFFFFKKESLENGNVAESLDNQMKHI